MKIWNSDKDELEKFANDLHKVVYNVYNKNLLKVNCGKTQILQVESNTADCSDPERKFVTITDNKGNKIPAKTEMKILGITLNAKASMETNTSRLKSKVRLELSKIKPYLTSMQPSDRKLILNSKLKSILDYGLPLYMGGSECTLNRLEATYMTINCIIHSGYTFRVNKTKRPSI